MKQFKEKSPHLQVTLSDKGVYTKDMSMKWRKVYMRILIKPMAAKDYPERKLLVK